MSIFSGTLGTVLLVLLMVLAVAMVLILFAACYLYDFCNLFPQSKVAGRLVFPWEYKDYVLLESPRPTKIQPPRKRRQSKKAQFTLSSPPGYGKANEFTYIENRQENRQEIRKTSDLPILIVTDTDTEIKKRLRRPNSVAYLGLGKITFSLQYNNEAQALVVYLISGKDICFRNGELATLPSVKIRIDDQKNDEQESNRDESHNPDFDQEFIFELPADTLGERILNFSIWDTLQGLHKTILGYVSVPLANFLESLIDPEGTGPLSREITESRAMEQPLRSNGNILFSLSYSSENDKLHVAILRCKDVETDSDDSELYVRVTMSVDGKDSSRKITPTVVKNSDPVFNEFLIFENCSKDGKMDQHRLSLTIVLKEKRIEGDDHVLGQVIVGQNDGATAEGISHWKETWSCVGTAVAQWHSLAC